MAEEFQQEARRAVLYVSALALAGFGVGGLLLIAIGLSGRYCLIAASFNAAVFVVGLARPQISRRDSLVLFAVAMAVTSFGIWGNNEVIAVPGRPVAAFADYQVAMIALALIVPSGVLGALLIAGLTLIPVVQFLSWPAARVAFVPMLEPWQTVIVGAAAFCVLHARRKQVRTLRDIARIQVEAAWLERVARLSLFLRDLANTPLQTLTLGVELMRAKCASLAATFDEMDRAISQLSRLNRTLAPVAGLVPSYPIATGFNALEDLEGEIAESIRGRTGVGGRAVAIESLDPQREAAKAAMWLSWISASVGLAFLLVFEWQGLPQWAILMIIGAGLSGVGLTLIRPDLPRTPALLLIVVLSTIAFAAVWISADVQAELGKPFAPYGGLRIAMLALMLLVPSIPVGVILLGAATLLPVLQTSVWSADMLDRMPLVEPWLTMNLGQVMIVALVVRRRHVAKIRAAAARVTESAWLERLAHLSLLVRELSSESINVVRTATTRLIGEPCAPQRTQVHMQAAVTRLAKINDLLAPLGQVLHPRPPRLGADDLEIEVKALIAHVADARRT